MGLKIKRNEYSFCTYLDIDNDKECCNGTEEGTICIGCFGKKCEAYERYTFSCDYIELTV